MQRGFFEAKEMDARQGWEQARMTAYFAVKPHAKRGQLTKITDLIKFEWDKNRKVELPSREYIMQTLKKYGQFYNAETDKFHN